MTRKERLQQELAKAEALLDGAGRTMDTSGAMAWQVKMASMRCRVLQLRAELLQIDIDDIVGKGEAACQRRRDLVQDRASLLTHVKNAEQAARAASKQETDDKLPEVLRRLNEQTEVGEQFGQLH